ncbi:protein phosphatase methylesterase, partial [Pelomyxa schiedti]
MQQEIFRRKLAQQQQQQQGGPMGPPPLPRSITTSSSSECPPTEADASHNADEKGEVKLAIHPDAWREYFDRAEDVVVPSRGKFRVYVREGVGDRTLRHPVFFMVHGAGHSAMSFAIVSAHIAQSTNCTIYCIDMRAHGLTTTENDVDLSVTTLCDDVASVIETMMPGNTNPLFLVGHSMGGGIVVKASTLPRLRPQVSGIVVLDVVEGTALGALPSMRSILQSRPRSFPSIEQAITYNLASGGTRNPVSAQVSVPALFVLSSSGEYVWRSELACTERFWPGWFNNLSEEFLRAPGGKLLILAGTDRLDKPLMIAHMQGKFQLKVMPTCGHLVHEDDPSQVANTLLSFSE